MKPPVIWKPAANGNYLPGRINAISRITFHHIVGDAPAAIARFQTPGVQVSTNYVISSMGTIYQMVADQDTPYSDDNWNSNTRTISIEHAGGLPSVPYTDAMYDASIRLVTWLISQYGINDFKRHRDVSDDPTACPGNLDVERIISGTKGGDVSTVGEYEIRLVWPYVFGYEASDNDVKAWIGSESNTFLRAIVATPQAAAYKQFKEDQAKAAAGNQPSKYELVTEPLYKEVKK